MLDIAWAVPRGKQSHPCQQETWWNMRRLSQYLCLLQDKLNWRSNMRFMLSLGVNRVKVRFSSLVPLSTRQWVHWTSACDCGYYLWGTTPLQLKASEWASGQWVLCERNAKSKLHLGGMVKAGCWIPPAMQSQLESGWAILIAKVSTSLLIKGRF